VIRSLLEVRCFLIKEGEKSLNIGNKLIEEITVLTNKNEVIAVISDNEIIENKDFKIRIKPASSKLS